MDPSAPLTLRDFLQYVLPALLAGCMYAPLLTSGSRVTPEGIIFGAVILSYIIWSPMYDLARWFYKNFPWTRARVEKAFAASKATVNKWDKEKLRYLLTSDEREYLYSHGSFAALYAVAGLHLFVYAAINLFLLGKAASAPFRATTSGTTANSTLSTVGESARTMLRSTTPSIADFQVNTLFLFAASVLLFYFSYKQYMYYYELLSKEGGQYDQLAQKYFKTDESVARGVSGRVRFHEGPEGGHLFHGAAATLKKTDGTVLDETKVDAQGRFQFACNLSECWMAQVNVVVNPKGTEAEKELAAGKEYTQVSTLSKDQVPYVEVRVQKPEEKPLPPKEEPKPQPK